jgi:hypothetical protein
MQAQETTGMPKIMRQKGDAGIVRQVTAGITVLVEGEESAFWPQSLQDAFGMAAAAKGAVDVSSVRLYPQAVEGFFQQDGEVIPLILL